MKGIARVFEFLNYWICANAISVRADIGADTKFWHRGLGCTVHYKAKIGKNCRILLNAMIGSKFANGVPDDCYASGSPAITKTRKNE